MEINRQCVNKIQLIDFLDMQVRAMEKFDGNNYLNEGKKEMCKYLHKLLKDGFFDSKK